MSDKRKIYKTKHGEQSMTEAQYQEYLRQQDNDAHKGFFKGKPQLYSVHDEQEVKQQMRRAEKLTEMTTGMVPSRVKPGGSPNIEYISFERWTELQAAYKQALTEGFSEQQAWQEVGYQPLSAYVNKIQPKGRTPIRPLLQHEVGIRPNGVILLLQDRMPGDVGTVVVGPHTAHKTGGEEAT